MTRRIAIAAFHLLAVVPCAMVFSLSSSANAAEYALFPGSKTNNSSSQIPRNLPPLAADNSLSYVSPSNNSSNNSNLASVGSESSTTTADSSNVINKTAATAIDSLADNSDRIRDSVPTAGKPLRVVIPNIHGESQNKNHAANEENSSNDNSDINSNVSSNHDYDLAEKRDESSEKSATKLSAKSQSSRQSSDENSAELLANGSKPFIPESARKFWNNGVIIADWTNTMVIRAMLKPSVDFLPLPPEWQIASADNLDNLAALAPAAGDATAEIVQSAPLSSESKDILQNIPSVADKDPAVPLKKKVNIDRARETGDVLKSGENSQPLPNSALGLKVGEAKARFDVNYELERAYNALIAGKSDIAIQIYEDILTGDPKNKEAIFGLASTYHRSGQISMARSLYGKLLQLDPKHRDGLNNFLVLLAEESPNEALSQMEALEGQNPDFSPIPAQMAIIYQKLGDRDKAVDKMYRALAIAPENLTYRYNLAVLLDGSGKYDDAGKLYAQILSSHAKGEVIPGDATKIQQRLTFIRSNISQ